MARRTGDTPALVYTLASRRIVIWGPDAIGERLDAATELQRLAREVGDHALAMEGGYWRARALLELGDIEAVDAAVGDYARLVDAGRQPRYRSDAETFRAMRALLAGRFDEAEAIAVTLAELGEQLQDQTAGPFALAQRLFVRHERGLLEDLAGIEPAVRERAEGTGTARWGAMLAMLYADLGREGEARGHFELLKAARFTALPRDFLWRPALTCLVETCVYLGDVGSAEALYRLLLPHAALFVTEVGSVGSVARHLGMPATLLNCWDEADAHFEAALAANARVGARPALAHTRDAYAAMLIARRRRGDLPRARALLEEAVAAYTALGMTRWAGAAEVRLHHPGKAAASPAMSIYPNGLTEREAEVLRLIAAGRNNREIADELMLSVRTVERHITNIYAKINARGKADATAYALRRGL